MNKLHRLRMVAELNRAGFNQPEIAAKVGCHPATVSKDLKIIGEKWLSLAVKDVAAARKRELAEIDAQQVRAEDAWQRSIGMAVKTKTESGGAKDGADEGETGLIFKTVEEAEWLVGDPRFLDKIQWCIEQRAKIWGLYAATKQEVEVKDTSDIEQRIARRIDSIVARIGADSAVAEAGPE